MSYRVCIDGHDVEAEILARRPQLQLRLNDRPQRVEAAATGATRFELTLDGVRYQGWRFAYGDAVHVRLNGHSYLVEFPRRALPGEGTAAQDTVRASMPGVVVAVHVKVGDAVQAGDKLLTLESMKLQMTVVASHASSVREIHVLPEAVFQRGALLVSFGRTETSVP